MADPVDMRISQLSTTVSINDTDVFPVTQGTVTDKVEASTLKSYVVDDLEVSDLYDTTITTPTDNDGLVYNATAQKWENVPITTKEQWKKNGAYNVGYHNFTTQTLNGITFTVNADKSITLNNTATATTTIHLFQTTSASVVGLKEGTQYKLVGLTPTTPSCTLKVNCYYNSANHVAEDSGNGATFTFTGTSYGDFFYDYYLTIPSGTAFNNNTIYPMITTDLNATYDDFVPYAMTNGELTNAFELKSIHTDTLSGNSDVHIQVPVTNVRAIIPYGFVPDDSWDTQIVFTKANPQTGIMDARVNGTTSQKYRVFYWVVK